MFLNGMLRNVNGAVVTVVGLKMRVQLLLGGDRAEAALWNDVTGHARDEVILWDEQRVYRTNVSLPGWKDLP